MSNRKRIITQPTLILMGITLSGLSGMASVYTPVEKNRPNQEFVNSTYISTFKVKGQMKESLDMRKSEERKRILKDIRSIREQIRLTQEEINAADRLVDFCTGEFMKQSGERITKLVDQRAKELNVDIKYIKLEQLARRKGVVLINEFEIA